MRIIKTVKKEIRIIGIDDSPFDKYTQRKALVVGTIYRGGDFPDGIVSTKVNIDGSDSTKKLIEMINNSKHKSQLQIIMLDGIAFGGFNVVDVHQLSKETNLPVITIMRDYRKMEKIEIAIKNVKFPEKKIGLIRAAGKVHKAMIHEKPVYFQNVGIEFDQVVEILKMPCTRSVVPEPIRMSHLIASGIAVGESKGRA